MKLFDQRGFVPAAVRNKTDAALNKLAWANSGLSYSGAEFSVWRTADWEYGVNLYVPTDPCYTIDGESYDSFTGDFTEYLVTAQPDGFTSPFFTSQTSNWMYSTWEPEGITVATAPTAFGGFFITAQVFGAPEIFKNLDDDWTVDGAKIEISCSSINFHLQTAQRFLDGSPDIITDVYDHPDLSFVVIALLRDGSYEVVGSFPAGGSSFASPRTLVSDATSMVQEMWDRKRDGVTVGYGVVVSFGVASGGSLHDLLDGCRQPNTSEFVFIPEGATCPTPFRAVTVQWTLDWANPVITGLRIKVAPPDIYDKKDVITEPLPPMD
jgi:hypothetical protein